MKRSEKCYFMLNINIPQSSVPACKRKMRKQMRYHSILLLKSVHYTCVHTVYIQKHKMEDIYMLWINSTHKKVAYITV
uniref:Uncharacterized protein n=1 Tax=Anguilla anguilla TaxID=7936 RepID=A0A0E9X770_ANGAN